MSRPIVAIVGKPNVGKSTLFNRIAGRRIAVVEDVPGLTRDRLYREARWEDKVFLVVDTGGFQSAPKGSGKRRERGRYPGAEDEIAGEVRKQALHAVHEADVVLMLMDSESGLMPSEKVLIDALRKSGKDIVYAINKIDGPTKEKRMYDYFSIGTDLYPVSAKTGYRFDELMDRLVSALPRSDSEEPGEYPRVAIVGRPNVGKSTLVNALLGKERVIVSPVPGTTRDSIDSVCSYYGKKYLIVDTAGIRRKGKMSGSFERYSFLRTLRNIELCDVALILLDGTDGVVELDKKIAGLVYEAGKGCLLVINKWDMVEKNSQTAAQTESRVYQQLWFMNYAPVLTMSALKKKRATKIFPLIDTVSSEAAKKISTKELNDVLRESLKIRQHPLYRGKKVTFSYITQTGTKPPSFTVFSNRAEGVRKSYIKFLEKRLRKTFSFQGVPVRIVIKQKT